MSVAYRLQQFWHNLMAGPLPKDVWEEITAVLTPTEVDLFRQFTFSDQWHSYRVLQTVRKARNDHPSLCKAALLHDIGKICVDKLTIWERTLIVIIQWCFPWQVVLWGQGEPVGWKRPFVIRQQHAAWGAELAKKVGCSATVVALIRRHQDKPTIINNEEDQLLAHLQWADDQN
jgi:putative nucleotidyltransferase with HDIG domain